MSFRTLLKENDITAARLSRKIGVTKETVSNWCRGKNKPQNIVVINKIATALETDVQTVINCLLAEDKNK